MKKLIFILLFGALAFFTKAQSVDTLGSCIVFKNEKNSEFIVAKSAAYLYINPASPDLIVISTIGNKDIFNGKLSLLTVPGAASNPAKLAFLKKQISTSLGGMGGSSDAKQAKQDVQITLLEDITAKLNYDYASSKLVIEELSGTNGTLSGLDTYWWKICNVGNIDVQITGNSLIKLKPSECIGEHVFSDDVSKKLIMPSNISYDVPANGLIHLTYKQKL